MTINPSLRLPGEAQNAMVSKATIPKNGIRRSVMKRTPFFLMSYTQTGIGVVITESTELFLAYFRAHYSYKTIAASYHS